MSNNDIENSNKLLEGISQLKDVSPLAGVILISAPLYLLYVVPLDGELEKIRNYTVAGLAFGLVLFGFYALFLTFDRFKDDKLKKKYENLNQEHERLDSRKDKYIQQLESRQKTITDFTDNEMVERFKQGTKSDSPRKNQTDVYDSNISA